MTKRITALLLALLLLVNILPMGAFAQEGELPPPDEDQGQNPPENPDPNPDPDPDPDPDPEPQPFSATASAGNITVTVSAPAGAFPNGTQLQADLADTAVHAAVLDSVAPNRETSAVLSIGYVCGGESVAPTQSATVILCLGDLITGAQGKQVDFFQLPEGRAIPFTYDIAAGTLTFLTAAAGSYAVTVTAPPSIPDCTCSEACTGPNEACERCYADWTQCSQQQINDPVGSPQDEDLEPTDEPVRYKANVTATLVNSHAAYYFTTPYQNPGEWTFTPMNGASPVFQVEKFAGYGRINRGFVVFFVKPQENHLLTHVKVGDRISDIYPIDKMYTQGISNIWDYPCFTDATAKADIKNNLEAGNYQAAFGFYRGGISTQACDLIDTFSVYSVPPQISLNVSPSQDSYHKDEIAKFNVTVTPTIAGITNAAVKNMVITVVPNGDTANAHIETPEDTKENDELNSYQFTIQRKITQSDLDRGSILLEANASADFTYNLLITSTASYTATTSGSASATASINVPVIQEFTVSYRWAEDNNADTQDFPAGLTLPEAVKVDFGAKHTVSTIPQEDATVTGTRNDIPGTWTFNGWDKEGTFSVEENTVITGTWEFEPDKYTVTYAWDGDAPSGAQLPSVSTVTAGSEHSIQPGYDDITGTKDNISGIWHFTGWQLPDGFTAENGKVKVTQDIEITGAWTFTPTHTVTYAWKDTAPSGTSLPTPASVTVLEGSTHTIAPGYDPVTDATGIWTFGGWKLPDGISAENGQVTVNQDITITGDWTFSPTYTVTYAWAGDAPSSARLPDSVTVTEGSSHTIADGYDDITGTKDDVSGIWHFTGWQLPDGITAENGKVTVTRDIAITGSWTFTPTYTVTYAWEGDAPSSARLPGAVTVKEGSAHTIAGGYDDTTGTKDDVSGTWHFTGWQLPDGITSENGKVTVTRDIAITGSWTFSPTYTVTFVFQAEEGGSIEGTATQVVNATPNAQGSGYSAQPASQVTPKAAEGYVFDCWKLGTTVVANPFASQSVTPNQTYTYTAHFTPDKVGGPDGSDSIADKYQKKVIFYVVNGKWKDLGDDTRVVYLTLKDAAGNPSATGKATLTAPTDMTPNRGYSRKGTWDKTPPTQVSGTDTETYTFRYVKAVRSISPNTGDRFPLGTWALLGGAAAAALILILLKRKKH